MPTYRYVVEDNERIVTDDIETREDAIVAMFQYATLQVRGKDAILVYANPSYIAYRIGGEEHRVYIMYPPREEVQGE